MRKLTNFIAGFFVGGLVGAAAGLVLAPQGGEEFQERLKRRFDALMKEGKEAAAARQAELEAQLEAFKRGQSTAAHGVSEQS